MKKSIFFTVFSLFLTTGTFAQIVLLTKASGDSTLYRFRWDEIQQNDEVEDTLTRGYYPERYLSYAETGPYIISQIAIHTERINMLRKAVAEENGFINDFIGHYDDVYGTGAHLAYSKAEAAKFLTGTWKLRERNGDVFDVVIDEQGQITGDKTGTIAMNDEYDIVATGLYSFDLTFTLLQNGILRAVRNTANGPRIFTLRRVSENQ